MGGADCGGVYGHSQWGRMQQMVDNVSEKFCQLDILVCDLRICEEGMVSQIDERAWRTLFGIYTDGVRCGCQVGLPWLIDCKMGAMITVSSVQKRGDVPGAAACSAAGSAAITDTAAEAEGLALSGIQANFMVPEGIGAEMNGRRAAADFGALAKKVPLGRTGWAEEMAKTSAFGVSGEVFRIVGQVVVPGDGLII